MKEKKISHDGIFRNENISKLCKDDWFYAQIIQYFDRYNNGKYDDIAPMSSQTPYTQVNGNKVLSFS